MILETVVQMLAEYKNLELDAVKAESTFEELKLDSLDVADLVMNMEDKFGVSIDLDESVKTVAELVARIESADKL